MERNRAEGKLRYCMVGGGPGAFIGVVHRKAIALDSSAELVAGVFSSDSGRSAGTGRELGLDPSRVYPGFEEMARSEAERADGADFVVVVTPNDSHYAVSAAFLRAGMHVVCDKPLCLSVSEGESLAALAAERNLLFCVTYAYTGYAAVKQARAMLASGAIGEIKFINAEYPQEFFARPVEREGNKQAAWRFDPTRSGPVGSLGDIGTHIENMVSYMTGLRLRRVCARLDSFVPGRELDDNDVVMTEYEGGATGLYWSCQAAFGNENGLRVRVYGSEGSLSWSQEDPEHLTLARAGEPIERWARGRETFVPAAQGYSRVPAGHPEGYFEAFANVYRAFAATLRARIEARAPDEASLDYPGVESGIAGLRFVAACLASSKAGSTWASL